MWFVFPQLKGLGISSTSRKYGISGITEARAYLRHPVLGPRLRESTSLVLAFGDRSPGQIFGYPDDMKFRSSMTLFSLAESGEGGDHLFDQALDVFFAGERDARTMDMLERAGPGRY